MIRRRPKSFVLAAVALAILAGAGCKNDSNMISNPLPAATMTPLPGAPTPTRTPLPAADRVVNVGQNGGLVFADQQAGGSTTTIAAGTTVQWVWVSGFHSTTSGTCSGTCTPDGSWDSGAGSGMTFSHTFNQAGTFPYFCSVHGAMMTGTVVVN
jgi:plastocyanin